MTAATLPLNCCNDGASHYGLQKNPVLRMILRPGVHHAIPRSAGFETLILPLPAVGGSGGISYGRVGAGHRHGRDNAGIDHEVARPKARLGLSKQKTPTRSWRTPKRGPGVFESLPGWRMPLVIETPDKSQGNRVWTAQMFLMFALRRPDVLPAPIWEFAWR